MFALWRIALSCNWHSCVDAAIEAMDEDRTVCKTLAAIHPDIFAKGGDQFVDTIPEATVWLMITNEQVCREMGIQMVDRLGEKIQSSSWLIEGAAKLTEEKAKKDGKVIKQVKLVRQQKLNRNRPNKSQRKPSLRMLNQRTQNLRRRERCRMPTLVWAPKSRKVAKKRSRKVDKYIYCHFLTCVRCVSFK